MDWKLEEENVIRRYLLDDATTEERRRVEERLLEEDDFGELLLLIEGELIDDYAGGAMSEREQSLFRRNFLFTLYRQGNLAMAQEVMKYAASNGAVGDEIMRDEETVIEPRPADNVTRRNQEKEPAKKREWLQTIFYSKWKIAVYTVLVLIAVSGYWLLRPSESELALALNTMNRAYSERRPLETRITGFSYAPFPRLLGGEPDQGDYVAIDRAERILLDAIKRRPDVATQHSLGRLYLAQKKFDQAKNLFEMALRSEPDNARLHSDLGATVFEKWDLERSVGQSAVSEELERQSLEHLTRALMLDGSLHEARFNRALLYQNTNQTQLAREEWKKYLASDRDSPWAKEAEDNLKRLRD
jgi:tetratricopeptide (TPR) repeat protein